MNKIISITNLDGLPEPQNEIVSAAQAADTDILIDCAKRPRRPIEHIST